MKTLLILFFLLFSSSLAAASIYDEPAAQETGEPLETLKTIEEWDDSAQARIDEVEKAKENSKIVDEPYLQYFDKFVPDTNCDVETIKCPGLVEKHELTHSVLLDGFSLRNGTLQCSVHLNERIVQNHYEPVFVTIFQNQSCKSKFSKESNNQSNKEIEAAILIAQERDKELQELRFSYEDLTQTGSEKYLDLADWLDALVTVDAEKINLQQSLDQGMIQVNYGFTTITNGVMLDKFKTALSSLFMSRANMGDYSSLSSSEIEQLLAENELQNTRNREVADNKYLGFLDFFINANSYFMEILNMIALTFISFNLIMWIFKKTSEKASKMNSNENYVMRVILGLFIIVFFYVGESSRLEFQDSDGNLVSVEFDNTRAQSLIRIVYGFTNEIADNLARLAIDSHLKTSALDSGVWDASTIRNLNTEKNVLLAENEMLKRVEREVCQTQFDVKSLENDLRAYREEVLKVDQTFIVNEKIRTQKIDNEGKSYTEISWKAHDQSSLINQINPYPRSEREAFAIVEKRKEKAYLLYLNDISQKSFHSFTSCSNTLNNILKNNSRINDIERKLDFSKEDKLHNYRIEKLRATNEIMNRNFAELGYLSIIFLPAASLIADSDENFQDNKLMNFEEDSETDMLRHIAESMPLFFLFGGKEIADSMHDLLPVSWNPFTQVLTRPLSYYISIEFIKQAIEVISILVLIVSAIAVFIILTLQKLWSFFAISFIGIYAFSEDQESKMIQTIARILAVSFKIILLVITMYLAIWSLSLVDSLEKILLGTFFDNLQDGIAAVAVEPDGNFWEKSRSVVTSYITEFSQSVRNYAILGFSTVAFMILKIILSVMLIFKLPSYFFSLLGADNVNDFADKITEQVVEASQRESMKGI